MRGAMELGGENHKSRGLFLLPIEARLVPLVKPLPEGLHLFRVQGLDVLPAGLVRPTCKKIIWPKEKHWEHDEKLIRFL